jgi:hypothetical protein
MHSSELPGQNTVWYEPEIKAKLVSRAKISASAQSSQSFGRTEAVLLTAVFGRSFGKSLVKTEHLS